MKEYVALVSIPAENEEDFLEQLDALDSYELEWWKQVKEWWMINVLVVNTTWIMYATLMMIRGVH